MKNSKNQAEMSLANDNTDAVHRSQVIESKGLSSLTPEILTTSIKESFATITGLANTFKRDVMAELRNRMLPLLDECVKRIKDGIPVNGETEVEAFYKSLNLNPVTVRSWYRRALETSEQHKLGAGKTEKRSRTMESIFKRLPDVKAKATYIENLKKDKHLSAEERQAIATELESRGNQLILSAAYLTRVDVEVPKPKKAAKKKVVTTGISEEKPNYSELAKQTREHQDAVEAAKAAKTPAA